MVSSGTLVTVRGLSYAEQRMSDHARRRTVASASPNPGCDRVWVDRLRGRSVPGRAMGHRWYPGHPYPASLLPFWGAHAPFWQAQLTSRHPNRANLCASRKPRGYQTQRESRAHRSATLEPRCLRGLHLRRLGFHLSSRLCRTGLGALQWCNNMSGRSGGEHAKLLPVPCWPSEGAAVPLSTVPTISTSCVSVSSLPGD